MKKRVLFLLLGILFVGCGTKTQPSVQENTSNNQQADKNDNISHDMLELITRVNEYAYVTNDLKLGIKFNDTYWNSASESGKNRELDFRENNEKIISKLNAIINYSKENKIEVDPKTKEEVEKQVNKIFSGKNNFLDYCSMYNYIPSKENLEELYSYYVLEDKVKNRLGKVEGNNIQINNAASVYEVKIPIKLTENDDYEKQLKISRKIASDIVDELKNGEAMIEVATKFGVLSYPIEYDDYQKNKESMADYINKLFKAKFDEIVGPYEITENNEVKYILIGKVSEENNEKTVSKKRDILIEKEKNRIVDEKLKDLEKQIYIDTGFLNNIQLKSAK